MERPTIETNYHPHYWPQSLHLIRDSGRSMLTLSREEELTEIELGQTRRVELAAKYLSTASMETALGVEDSAEMVTANAESITAIAAAAEELNASIFEISGHISQVSDSTSAAVSSARETGKELVSLEEASTNIKSAISVIEAISRRITILALNASIEASRAGEAGKGFAVVANEVKSLAAATSSAATEVTDQLLTISRLIQMANVRAKETIDSNEKIAVAQTQIAEAVAQQSAATAEISGLAGSTSHTANAVTELLGTVAADAWRSMAFASYLETTFASDQYNDFALGGVGG